MSVKMETCKGIHKQKLKTPRQKPQRRRLSESDDDGSCVVCANHIVTYAVGYCDHYICIKCSMKMRLLCEEKFCPVCRKDLLKVIFTKEKKTFKELNQSKLVKDTQNNVNYFFENLEIIKEYKQILEYRCPICPDRPPDKTFNQTKAHLRKDHSLFHCEICLTHIKNFCNEYKVYNRKDLATHKRMGDEDDTSHRGHPLCEFCEERYLDDDQLFRHLRKQHYYCHICDQADINEFYGSYRDLHSHFKKDHFVCEIDECRNQQFTSVFPSELDLKAHKAAVHNHNKSKHQQKMDRQIDLGFQYPKREQQSSRGRGHARGQAHSSRNQRYRTEHAKAFERESDLEKAMALSMKENEAKSEKRTETKDMEEQEDDKIFDTSADFPSLGNVLGNQSEGNSESNKPTASAAPSTLLKWTKGPNVKKPGLTEKEFPSLKSHSPQQSHLEVNKPGGDQLHTSHKQKWTSANSMKPNLSEEDFPSLGNTKTSNEINTWVSTSSGQTKTGSKSGKSQRKVQMKASDFVKDVKSSSAAGKKVKKAENHSKNYASKEDDDFPTLNPENSLLVGRGKYKHVESYSSFADEKGSNVKLVTQADCQKQQQSTQNNPKSLDLVDDFPMLGLGKPVAAPPGFECVPFHKASQKGCVSETNMHSFAVIDYPSLSATTKAVSAPPGFGPKPQAKKKHEVTDKPTSSNGFMINNNDFPGLPKKSKPKTSKVQTNAGTTLTVGKIIEPDVVPQLKHEDVHNPAPVKPPVKQRGFKSQNPDQDFPSLFSSNSVPLPPNNNTTSDTDNYFNITSDQPAKTGTSLNLANIFDFPSL